MSLQVYDNFDRPGYSLADYSEMGGGHRRACRLVAVTVCLFVAATR